MKLGTLFALLVLFTAGFGSLTSSAQLPFTIEVHDSTATIGPLEVIDLKAYVTNAGSESIDVRLQRIVNELPNNYWFTALCFGPNCYEYTNDSPPPTTLTPGERVEFKLTVGLMDSFPRPTDAARVQIKFDTGLLTDAITVEFRINAKVAGVREETILAGRPAWPNPASERLTIPLPPDVPTSGAHAVIVDQLGRIVASVDEVASARQISVDISSLPEGAYRYRLSAGERVWSAPVVIVR
jgi:hypothetical protein